MDTIKFITGNEGKYSEAKKVISTLEKIDFDLPEIQSLDPKEIITVKLQEAIKTHKGNFIVEDTSLIANSLNNFPGPLVKWVLKSVGNQGLYDMVENKDDKSARAVCMIGLVYGGNISFFESEVEGEIVKPKGENGFGWDPVFKPTDSSKTFGEMQPEEKEKYNMRVKALLKLKKYLSSNG